MASPDQQHMLFLSSKDSKQFYPTNSTTEFHIELPQSLDLQGQWFCAITEVHFMCKNTSWKEVNIFTDICGDSYVYNTNLPILRRISYEGRKRISHQYTLPYYHRVLRNQIKRVNITLKDEHLNPVSFVLEPFTCVLHLRKVS